MNDTPTSIAEPLIEDLGAARAMTQGIEQPDGYEDFIVLNARD